MYANNALGNKISNARKQLNLSQAELAQKVAISPQAVGKWERGESQPDFLTLMRLAEIFGVDLNFFAETSSSVLPDIAMEKHTISTENANEEPLKSRDMSQGNWENADFSGLNQLKEKFSSSNMRNCNFSKSDLRDLLLSSNNVESCNFSESDWSSSQLRRSNLGKNNFTKSILRNTQITSCNIEKCDFTQCDFSGASFQSTNLSNNIIEDAQWNNTSFHRSAIDQMIFSGTIRNCSFDTCGFYKVTFRDATLTNCFFKNNKNLKRIQFINCKADRITLEFLKSGKASVDGIELVEGNQER